MTRMEFRGGYTDGSLFPAETEVRREWTLGRWYGGAEAFRELVGVTVVPNLRLRGRKDVRERGACLRGRTRWPVVVENGFLRGSRHKMWDL